MPKAAKRPRIKRRIRIRTVRWQAILEKLAADGFDTFVETGAGKTLCGLVKKTVKGAKIIHVEDAATLEAALKELKQEV